MKRGFLSAKVVVLAALTAVAGLCVASATGDRPHVTGDTSSPGTCTPWPECTYPPTVWHTIPAPTPTLTPTGTPAVTPAPTPTAIPKPNGDNLPFYGMDTVFAEDLPLVASLGAEVVAQKFSYSGTPMNWLDQLDEAQAHDLQVIAWLWPQGWQWDGTTWHIDHRARSFVQTVAGHPATFAVFALHEPYWQGCWGCGYTTYEQQLLYDAIKAIADVPIYSAVDSIAFWTAQGEETAFADGVCDYCGTWYHPFRTDGYKREEFLEQLYADLAVARERGPKSKIVWAMQAFAQDQGGFRMPTSAEMYDLAGEVYAAGVDGAMWHPWTFNSLYDDFLSNHPELYDTVRQVYEDHVLPRR